MNNLNSSALLKAAGIGAGAVLVLSLLSQIPVVGIACCCVLYLGYAGIGALYGVFVRQDGMAVEPGPLALGGAIAAAVAGVIQGLVGGIISFIGLSSGNTIAQMQQIYDQMGVDVPPEIYQMYSGAGMGVAAVAIGLCFSIIIGAILGAIGGAIYGATQRNSAPPAAPAPPAEPAM